MILRELTENEKKELDRFQAGEDGYKVLLGMIAVDLMQEKAYEKPIQYMEYADYIETHYYHKGHVFIIMPLVETWLTSLVKNSGIDINERIERKILYLNISYLYAICGQDIGVVGKKCKEMVTFFRELDEKLHEETGEWMENRPGECYRYIVTCLEYMGFQREPSTGDKVVDMSNIFYSDLDE